MGSRIIEVLDKGFESFTPRPEFEIIKVEDRSPEKVKHELLNY